MTNYIVLEINDSVSRWHMATLSNNTKPDVTKPLPMLTNRQEGLLTNLNIGIFDMSLKVT